ncbi:hypothetical protein PSH87_15510 [Pseudomonas sp. FP453]|uniref:hypothetical protein n=1 Tax=unclassified Pseudomonas TaxID=196821 RepID=UPI0012FAE954|nr:MULTISPECIES: hypothetical protein [unclassified Pseudomonas]WLH88076.1 hypothetical protein PSH87_15510 [Pseudomonas sp. FP453]
MAIPMIKPLDPILSTIKQATVVAIDELIDEEVTLLIDGALVTCFASYCPYEIEVGMTYAVELTLYLSEHYEAQKISSTNVLIERIDNSFAYALYGTLNNNTFNTFTLLTVDGIHHDHPDLNDSLIKLTVERIDVAFL